MLGLMQYRLLPIDPAATFHLDAEIVVRIVECPIHRTNDRAFRAAPGSLPMHSRV